MNSGRSFVIPKCVTTFREDTVGGIHSDILTSVYAINMVAIIVLNILLVIGICKTKKKNKYTNSNKLFLFLCASDLLAGTVLMPIQIYYLHLVPNITCLQTAVRAFWFSFPIVLSGTNILVITLDRYLMMVRNECYHRWFARNTLLVSIICLEVLISFGWALWYVFSTQTLEREMHTAFFISLSTYQFLVLTMVVVLNVKMVRAVALSRRNTTLTNNNRAEHILSRTITMISAALVICYTPGVVATGTVGFFFLYEADMEQMRRITTILVYCLLPTQINSALNAAIYLSRNSRIRAYYKRLCHSIGATGGGGSGSGGAGDDTNDSLASHKEMYRFSTKKQQHHLYVMASRKSNNSSIASLNRNGELPSSKESEM